MMPWALVGVGLALLGAGAGWQIFCDWREHGLTHLRYEAVVAHVLGSIALTAVAIDYAHPVLAAWVAAPGVGTAVVLIVKARDHGRSRRWWR